MLLKEGTVKWFSKEKGYGFISLENNEDHYFRIQDVKGAELPSNGDSVKFESTLEERGFRAKKVQILEKSAAYRDDRIVCPHCRKKMVPRIITYQGSLRGSVCPFCGGKIKNFSQCFIATAVYGSSQCHEVIILREFRDTRLVNIWLGRAFIQIYYRVSPAIANWLRLHPRLSEKVRRGLNIVVRRIEMHISI